MTAPRWADLASRWPNAGSSRFVAAGGLRWHVQVAGRGPALLLVHGTGAASFSWGGVLPLLTEHCTVIAPDLPGHGFTDGAREDQLTLPGMAEALAALLQVLGQTPTMLVGHSAGAAVLLQLALASHPSLVVGFAPALVPPPVAYRWLLAPLVHRIATTRLVSRSAATLAGRDAIVDSLLRSTGTGLEPARRRLYQAFFQSERHCHDVLTMMSRWSLDGLLAALPGLACPALLAAGREDHWIPLGPLRRIAATIPRAELRVVPGGHLFHEDRPDLAAEIILGAVRDRGIA